MYEDQYLRVKKGFETVVEPNVDIKWINWLGDSLESAVEREDVIRTMFKNYHFVGKKSDGMGIVVQDKTINKLVEITRAKTGFNCNVDKGNCNHILYACMHPLFLS